MALAEADYSLQVGFGLGMLPGPGVGVGAPTDALMKDVGERIGDCELLAGVGCVWRRATGGRHRVASQDWIASPLRGCGVMGACPQDRGPGLTAVAPSGSGNGCGVSISISHLFRKKTRNGWGTLCLWLCGLPKCGSPQLHSAIRLRCSDRDDGGWWWNRLRRFSDPAGLTITLEVCPGWRRRSNSG